MKHLHLLFVAVVIGSFLWRVWLAHKQSELLNQKWMKILPHALATGLLLSGIALVIQGGWLEGAYGWIVAKLVLMLAFIGLGIVSMKAQGNARWIALAGALYCFVYIVRLAFAKQIFWLF